MANLADLNVSIGADLAPLEKSLGEGISDIQAFANEAETAFSSASEAIDTLTTSAGQVFENISTEAASAGEALATFSQEAGTWVAVVSDNLIELDTALTNVLAAQSKLPESSANYAELATIAAELTAQIEALEAANIALAQSFDIDTAAADAAIASLQALDAAEAIAARNAQLLSIAEKEAGIFTLAAADAASVLAQRDLAAATAAAKMAIAEKEAGAFLSTSVVAMEEGAIAATGLAGAATAAGTALSFLRQAAYLIPGIGLAGIISFIGEALVEVVKDMGIFGDELKTVAVASASASSNISGFEIELNKLVETEDKSASKLGLVFDALSDSNTTLKDRTNLLNSLIKLAPTYLGHLDKEKSSYTDIAAAVQNYNDNIGRDLYIKALLPEYQKLIDAVIRAKAEIFRLKEEQKIGEIDGEKIDNTAAIASQTRVLAARTNELANAKKYLNSLAGGSFNLQEILFGTTPPAAAAVHIDAVSAALKKLPADLQAIRDAGFTNEEPILKIDEAEIKRIQQTIKTLLEHGFTNDSIEVQTLTLKIGELKTEIQRFAPLAAFKQDFSVSEALDGSGIRNRNIAIADAIRLQEQLEQQQEKHRKERLKGDEKDLQESLKKQTKFYSSLGGEIENVFENVFTTLLTKGKLSFDGLVQGLEKLLAKLAATAVEAGILSLILSTITGGTSIASGLGAGGTSFGALFKALIPHADGGIFTGPTQIGGHIFGEAGPEALLPINGNLDRFLGSQNQSPIVMDVVLKGNSLVLVQNRQDDYNKRNYGKFKK